VKLYQFIDDPDPRGSSPEAWITRARVNHNRGQLVPFERNDGTVVMVAAEPEWHEHWRVWLPSRKWGITWDRDRPEWGIRGFHIDLRTGRCRSMFLPDRVRARA